MSIILNNNVRKYLSELCLKMFFIEEVSGALRETILCVCLCINICLSISLFALLPQ